MPPRLPPAARGWEVRWRDLAVGCWPRRSRVLPLGSLGLNLPGANDSGTAAPSPRPVVRVVPQNRLLPPAYGDRRRRRRCRPPSRRPRLSPPPKAANNAAPVQPTPAAIGAIPGGTYPERTSASRAAAARDRGDRAAAGAGRIIGRLGTEERRPDDARRSTWPRPRFQLFMGGSWRGRDRASASPRHLGNIPRVPPIPPATCHLHRFPAAKPGTPRGSW